MPSRPLEHVAATGPVGLVGSGWSPGVTIDAQELSSALMSREPAPAPKRGKNEPDSIGRALVCNRRHNPIDSDKERDECLAERGRQPRQRSGPRSGLSRAVAATS